MRALALFAVASALAAAPLRAEVDVQFKGGRVDVHATTAPLAEVLDRLARATGMKVVQQGSNPTMLVSLSLENRTPAEAVFGVLEGLGLNYAFVLDTTGNRIETLVLAGASGTKVAASTAPAPVTPPRYVPARPAPPPASGPDDSAADDEDIGDAPADDDEEPVEEVEEEGGNEAPAAAAPGPRGNVLRPPAEPVFPSSPFAPRAPMFTPQPEPQPTPTPAPPKPNQP